VTGALFWFALYDANAREALTKRLGLLRWTCLIRLDYRQQFAGGRVDLPDWRRRSQRSEFLFECELIFGRRRGSITSRGLQAFLSSVSLLQNGRTHKHLTTMLNSSHLI
jgi:hypothetical protein